MMMVPPSTRSRRHLGSAFGWRIDPFTGRSALHTGPGLPGRRGTPIAAPRAAWWRHAGMHPQYGNMVEVDHGNGLITRYAHASRVLVKKGDLVKRGQKIAEVGTTGRSTGPHLHFEVLVQGVPAGPAQVPGRRRQHRRPGQAVARGPAPRPH
jgi:murein DD-endopeptidase MepM/ murein hydrolase activator NlpD